MIELQPKPLISLSRFCIIIDLDIIKAIYACVCCWTTEHFIDGMILNFYIRAIKKLIQFYAFVAGQVEEA